MGFGLFHFIAFSLYVSYSLSTSIDWGGFLSVTWGRCKQQTPSYSSNEKVTWDLFFTAPPRWCSSALITLYQALSLLENLIIASV
jgi:hypothetical protein